MPAWSDRLCRFPLLVIAIAVLSLALCVWTASASGILLMFRSAPPTDAARLRGRVVPLTGTDPFHPGKRVDLAALRAPVLVCRFEQRSGAWVLGAIGRLRKQVQQPFTLVAVFTAGDSDPPAWIVPSGLPFQGILVDADTMAAWGFQPDRPELRLVGADGAVASANLAGDDRDDTIILVNKALQALAPAP